MTRYFPAGSLVVVLMLGGCDAMSKIYDDAPCMWFCSDQTKIQTKYVAKRDMCQDQAELNLPMYVNAQDPNVSDDAKNAQLLSLFSKCMHDEDWGVTGPKVETPPGTAVAVIPTAPGATPAGAGIIAVAAKAPPAPGTVPVAPVPGAVVVPVTPAPTPTPTAPGIPPASPAMPSPQTRPTDVAPAPPVLGVIEPPRMAPPADPKERRKPVNRSGSSTSQQYYAYPPPLNSTTAPVPPPPASAYSPSNVPPPITAPNYAPAPQPVVKIPEYYVPAKPAGR